MADIGEIKARLSLDSAQFNSQVERAKKDIQQLGTESGRASGEINKASKELNNVGQSANNASKNIKSAGDSMLSLMGLYPLLASLHQVFQSITTAVKTTTDESNKLTNSLLGLKSVAQGVGASIAGANDAAKSLASDGLMSLSETSTSLKNLLSANFTLEQSVDIIKRFKDAAAFGRQSSLEFGYAVQSATEGIKNGNSILVDNAGVTKNLSVMLEEAGHKAQDLMKASNDSGIRMAIYNGILRETQHQVGDTAKLTDTLSGAQAKFNAQVTIAEQKVGEAYTPALQKLIETISPLVVSLGDMASANKSMVAGGTAATAAFSLMAGGLLSITTILPFVINGFRVLIGLTGPWGLLAAAVGTVVTTFFSYKAASDAVKEAEIERNNQTQQSFVRIASDAQALEQHMSTLKEGTSEYNRENQVLKGIYDQILATNPELKRGFEEHGNSLQWLAGQIRQVSAEYVAMQQNAYNAAMASTNALIAEKQARREQISKDLNVVSGDYVDANVATAQLNLGMEDKMLKDEIVALEQKQYKQYTAYQNMVKPVTAADVVTKYSKAPIVGGGGGGGSSSKSPKSGGSSVSKTPEQIAQEMYQQEMKVLQWKRDMNQISAQDEEDALKQMLEKYQNYADIRMDIELKIHQLEQQMSQDSFQFSQQWISDEELRMKAAGKTEEEIAQMKTDAWTRVRNRYAEDSDYYKQAERELLNLKIDAIQKEEQARKEAADKFKQELTSTLRDQESAYIDNLKKEQEAEIKSLEDNLKAVEDSYDRQISQQEEKLKLLDEEYAKEDRIKKLNDLNSQIDSVKADKRFEIIGLDGKKTLTYDTATVSELEKQRDELKQQYEREDIKQAIQDEIDRLKKAKDDKVAVMKAEIDAEKDRNAQELDAEKKRWDDLVKASEDGTLKFDELMSGKDGKGGWYKGALDKLKGYVDSVKAQMERLQSMYSSMPSAPNPTGGGGGGSSSGTITQTSDGWSYGGKHYGNLSDALSDAGAKGYEKHHSGGIAGLMNFASGDRLLPDEVASILQRSEFVFQPAQMRSMAEYLTAQAAPGGDVYNINVDKVFANDANTFMKSLDQYRRAVRS